MSSLNEKILSKIESETEVISAMPTNNQKNREKYLEKIAEVKEEFDNYQKEILGEMQRRCDELGEIEESEELAELERKIKSMEKFKFLINDIESSYQKLDLDRIIYKLSHFYRNNLEKVNSDILLCINKFKDVGVILKPDDFDYSSYVKKYMEIFFEEKNNINSEVIKETFEKIYWECPELITQIELNIRYLYYKNKNEIDKYFRKQKEAFIDEIKLKPDQIKDRYNNLNKQIIEKKKSDKNLIIEQFLNGSLNAKNYTDEALRKLYEKFIPKEVLNNANEKDMEEINSNLMKLLNNICEYQKYLKFKFLIDDIKSKYMEKDKNQAEYEELKKKINEKEKELRKLSNNKKGLFKKKAENELSTKNNEIIKELKELYGKLDKSQIYNKIGKRLNDNSTLRDVLEFAYSFYNYLVNCIIDNDKEIIEEDIEKLITELWEFISNPYNTIINNTTMLDERDIQLVIKDRYRLLGFNVTKEDFDEANLDSLISILSDIELGINIKKNQIDAQSIGYLHEFKKILS